MSEWNSETAEWYAANYGDYPTNRLAVDYLDLPNHISIVDVGCGTGSALRYAAQKVKDGNLIGIDPVPRMIEIARELTENHSTQKLITFKVGSAEDLPIDDDFANFVFAFDSIDHWKDVNQGLKEIRRILKPDGKLILVKDKAVPGSIAALKTLRMALDLSGYNLIDQNEINKEDVSFVLWICG
ncbi:MAG: class I SAM-dependent methyltransferase [Candidatus Bathyarchaeia archaeon]